MTEITHPTNAHIIPAVSITTARMGTSSHANALDVRYDVQTARFSLLSRLTS